MGCACSTVEAHSLQKKRDDLQTIVGTLPLISISTFLSWGGTQRRQNILCCLPESLEQIQAVVKACQTLKVRVRAAGTTHTFSPLYGDDGDLFLYTRNLRAVGPPMILRQPEDPEGNCEKKQVTVMTNVTTGQLMQFEIDHGICLPTNVVLDSVTYGGVVVPACHGTGRDCRGVSDYLTSLRIVDAHGVLREYSEDKDGPDMMRAVKANLGLFGILYDMNFAMDNAITVRNRNHFVSVQKMFYDRSYIKDIMDNTFAVEILWFPFNSMNLVATMQAMFDQRLDCSEWQPKEDEVWLRLVDYVKDAGPAKEYETYKLQNIRDWIQLKVGAVTEGVLKRFNSIAPFFLNAQFEALKEQHVKEGPVYQQMPHAIHFKSFITEMKVLNLEFIMDCDDNYDNFCKASQFVIELVHQRAKEGHFPLTMTLEVRLMAFSDLYLSPMQAGNPDGDGHKGSGHSICIEVLSMAETPGWNEFINEVAHYWMTLPGARTHWCKQWSEIDGIEDHLRKAYEHEFPKFLKQLEIANADPDRIFFNNTLEKLMLPKD